MTGASREKWTQPGKSKAIPCVLDSCCSAGNSEADHLKILDTRQRGVQVREAAHANTVDDVT